MKNLVENGRITEARNVLSDIQPGSSIKLDNWKRILAKPKAKISNSATGGKIKGDVAWLHKNSSHYKGRWIALKNGVLLDSDKSRVELHRSLKQAGKLSGAMFFRIGS